MHPAQHFRANFAQDEVVDTTSDHQTNYTIASTELHETDSHVRNLCFVWEDGRRAFFNYAYLVAAEFDPGHETNSVKLSFSSHSIFAKGYSLEGLFMALLDHLPRLIRAADPRYVLEEDKTDPVVIEIHVEKKDI